LCTRPYAADNPIDLSRFVTEDIDWDALLRLGEYHGLVPLIHAHLKASLPRQDLVGNAKHKDGFCRIEHAALANAARNALLTGKLSEIVGILTSHGIRALPFKGPVLAAQAYGDISMRAFDDLDLLVEKSDIIPAAVLLKPLGYEASLELSDAELRAHVRAGWGCALRSADRGFFVEFDSNVGADFLSVPLSFQQLWDRREKISMDGNITETVAVADLVPLLCVHGTKHLWRRLRWLADLAALLQAQSGIPWNELLEHSARFGCRRMVLAGFELCRKMTGAVLPNELDQAVAEDTAARKLARDFESGIFESGGRSGQAGHLRAMRMRWFARERWQDRIAGALRQAFTPGYSDWKSVRLPPALFPLYRIVRPIRLACDFAGGCTRR
jgi:hypothetical protein